MFNIRNVGKISTYIFLKELYTEVCGVGMCICVFGVCLWGVCVCIRVHICVCCVGVYVFMSACVCVCVCVGYVCAFSIHGESLAIRLLRSTFKSTSTSLHLTEICHLMISEAITASFCHCGGGQGESEGNHRFSQ